MRGVFLVFLLWRCVYCIPGNLSVNPCTDRHHLFLAPGVLTAGGGSRACVSRFYPEGPARMVLTLTTDSTVVTASRELPSGDGGCLDIAVPQKPNAKADLAINLWYPEAQCSWERRMAVRISSARLVVVQTERARYRPGDTLRVRILALKTNLSPALGHIEEIWLEGPRGAWDGTRAAEWRVVPTRMGVAQVQHDIDELAPTGRWTVKARLSDGSQGSAAFMVSNYQLPPFQMSVRHAAKVLKTSDRLVWTVCVRYPWTEAVEGMLVIRIRGAGGSGVNAGGIRTAVRLRAPRACHRHAAAAKRIGLNDANPPDVVVADFSFQEEGTGTWQNTTVVSQVVDKAVTLEFLTKNRAVISPGLPYKVKIKATRWDEKPASSERLRVCRTPVPISSALTSANLTQTCNVAVTDEKGVARVMFLSADDGSPYYKFEATLHNDSSVAAAPLQLPSHRGGSVYAALGPLRPDKQGDRTFVPLYLTVKNATKPVTVHFVVITRGGVIYRWGATTQCALTNSGDHFQVSSREGYCSNRPNPNVVQALDTHNNASDSLLDRQMFRVMLPVKVTHQMCPDSHLVAYFYYGDELVSASKHFEMDDCFANKVETNWLLRQVAPGSIARFQIKADSKALCALSALDIAAKIPQAPTAASALLAALKRLLDSQRNLTEYDAAGQCFFSLDSLGLPSSSLEFTARWLAAAGVRLVGGNMTPRSCEPGPAMMTNDDVAVPRSDFSEAWLWRLVEVSANGTSVINARAPDSISKFEANAICVTKTGLAVAAPATLQVFREFFIHADSPRRLRRGDSTIIRYRLFNYIYEPLSVQIQILTDPHLEGPVSYVETACVSARASAARHVTVTARLPGAARLSIRANVVKDANCANATSSRTGLSDEVIIQIMVDPEGVPVHDHQSALLCTEGSVVSRQSQEIWSWPRVNAVPGTETLTVWAVGDLAGPLLADADSLVLLPRGCGEQNMARLATNLLALSQLSPVTSAAATAREHVARGLTRQLQYVHPLGGFSAFGASDATPSTWLTAFSLKYLRKAHQMLSPGLPAPPALDRAQQWLLKQQMENGCFRNEGQVFHRELKGGLNEDGEIAQVALTAYVISALIESPSLSHRVVRNTLSCLRALPPMKIKTPARVYAQALLGYTYMKLRRYEDELRKTNEASLLENRRAAGLEDDEEVIELAALLKIAKRSRDYVWWETSSLATSIEATGYALLALSSCPEHLRDTKCSNDARGAVRWLASRANPAGGFVSTQDTLVALEALTTWLSRQPLPPSNLTITARGGHTVRTIRLKPGVKVPELTKMEVADQLHVAVKGSGCALIQATRSYNTISPDASYDKQLSVQVTVRTDGAFACDAGNTTCFCAAVIETCVVWLGAFPEMALLEVSLPGGYTADAALLYSQLHQANALLRRIELSSISGRATLYLGSRDGSDSLGHGGHRCYSIHAMGPRTRTKPAYARIVDYYAPSVNDTQMYTIPEDCPPRITTDINEYHSTDNLYAKAKSLTDSSEIVIMNEYTYEDIPEVIPLDDPMYDNLTQDEEQVSEIKVSATDSLNKINSKTENPIVYQTHLTSTLQSDRNIYLKESNRDIDMKTVDLERSETLSTTSYNDLNSTVLQKESGNNKTNFQVKPEMQSTTTYNYNLMSNIPEMASESYPDSNIPIENLINNETQSTGHDFDSSMIQPDLESNDKNKIIIEYPVKQESFSTTSNNYNTISTESQSVPESNHNIILTENPTAYETQSSPNVKFDEYDPDYFIPNKESNVEFILNKHLNQINKVNYIQADKNKVAEDKTPLKIYEDDLSREEFDKTENKHRIEERDDEKEREDMIPGMEKDNPNLSSFHVLDSDKDLDVPTGIEGPIPSIVLPPENFVSVALPPSLPPGVTPPRLPTLNMHRGFNYYPPQPYYYQDPYMTYRRYNSHYS